jgi:hypothetical protein
MSTTACAFVGMGGYVSMVVVISRCKAHFSIPLHFLVYLDSNLCRISWSLSALRLLTFIFQGPEILLGLITMAYSNPSFEDDTAGLLALHITQRLEVCHPLWQGLIVNIDLSYALFKPVETSVLPSIDATSRSFQLSLNLSFISWPPYHLPKIYTEVTLCR